MSKMNLPQEQFSPNRGAAEAVFHHLPIGLGILAIMTQIRRQGVWMRGLMCLSVLCLLPISGLAGQSVSLVWDPNPETNVTGYVIYHGTASGQYSKSNIVVGKTTTNTTISGLHEGVKYFFVVTAYDASGLESDPSNEISYRMPTISGLTNREMEMGTTKGVPFTVSWDTNLTGSLSLTARSSDSALVKDANIVITGSGSNYAATITPRPNAVGSATITIVVSNGTQIATGSFILNVSLKVSRREAVYSVKAPVTAANDVPTLGIVLSSPPIVPSVSNSLSKVKVTQNVALGRQYVLEFSQSLVTWTTDNQFTAKSETNVTEFVVGSTNRFFRIREVEVP